MHNQYIYILNSTPRYCGDTGGKNMGTWMCPRCDKPTLHSWSSSDGSEGCSCSNCGYIEQSGW